MRLLLSLMREITPGVWMRRDDVSSELIPVGLGIYVMASQVRTVERIVGGYEIRCGRSDRVLTCDPKPEPEGTACVV